MAKWGKLWEISGKSHGNLTEISRKSQGTVDLRLFLNLVKNVNIYNNFAHISEKLRTFALGLRMMVFHPERADG